MQAANSKNQGEEGKPLKKIRSPFLRKLRKYFYIFMSALFVFFVLFIYFKFYFTYSDGYRAGLLQKFSRKGVIFKTYEGEMILSSIKSNQNIAIASEKFIFSVTDKSLAAQLDTLQGESIVVHYRQKNSTLPWRGESVYIVENVKVNR